MKPKALGLRESIARAENRDIVNSLLLISALYQNASAHTKRRWANTARKRLRELAAVLMLFFVVGCGPSDIAPLPESTTVGNVGGRVGVSGVPVEEIDIKGHTYLAYYKAIIHAEHCKCKTQ